MGSVKDLGRAIRVSGSEGHGAGHQRLLCKALIHLCKTTDFGLAFQDHDHILPFSPVLEFPLLR